MSSAVPLRLILTRPKPQAAGWETALAEAGFDVALLPLIDIQLCPAPSDLPDLNACDAVFLVSRNALDGLLAWYGIDALQTAPVRWLCPGAGTAQQLQTLGVATSRISQPDPNAPQDSEHLWQALESQQPLQAGQQLLLVQGLDAAAHAKTSGTAQPKPNWLATQAQQKGVLVQTANTYQRLAPDFTVAQAELAQAAAQDGSVWLFSSSLAIGHLCHALPDISFQGAPCIATHTRIAQSAQQHGFTSIVCQPQLNDIAHAAHQWRARLSLR